MILEGIVTTLGADETPNLAPMGPRVEPGLSRFVLRPFKTSTTYRNLAARGEGVFHVVDDVLLLARAAIGAPVEAAMRPADMVGGVILEDACRYYEFKVSSIDDSDDRTTIHVHTVAQGHQREFFGLNRAKHAVVEAAILATRAAFLPRSAILDDLRRLAPLVEKTGGAAEAEAFALLSDHIHIHAIRAEP